MKKDIENIPVGYKNSPLGIIPKEWEVKKVKEICMVDANSLTSKTPPTYEFEYVSLSDIDSDSFEITTSHQIFSNAPSRARKIVRKGDVVISTVRPNLQGFFAIKDDVNNLIVSTGFTVLSPIFCDTQYLLSYFFSRTVSKQFYSLVVGSNYPAVNSSDVAKIKIAVPPLEEQRKISEVINIWDKAIEKQTKLIKKLELRKKGLMQQLLTGKKRLPGFSGEWKKVKAGLLFGSSSIRSNKLEPLLSVTQDKGVVPRDMLETRVTMPNGDLSSFKLVDVGDFVISLRSFEGGLEYSKYCGIVSPAYTVLKKKTDLSDVFYKVYFKSNDFIQCLAVAVIGIRDGKQISYSDFCYIKIPYPSLQEQNAIANVFVSCDNEILLAKQKLNHFQQQKKGLMQVLLTGKKRITQ